ncbi:DUF6691 family protein [Halosolutus halophilus]|uniref:DUF6691 family protein n=1 Tax=Halosolutus halophilus TaxID=1552990 RepID=UPI003CE5B6DA
MWCSHSQKTSASPVRSHHGGLCKTFDRKVIVGGIVFGDGWELSGVCPGAGCASLGIGKYRILWVVVGMFVGAYVQGLWRARWSTTARETPATDE